MHLQREHRSNDDASEEITQLRRPEKLTSPLHSAPPEAMFVSATKVVLILLLLIVVVTVVFIVRGPRPTTENDPTSFKNALNQTPSKHPMLDSANGILAPFAPKLAVTSLSPSSKTFDLSAKPEYDIQILPDSSKKFRQANFVVTPAKTCAVVVYTPSGEALKDPQSSNKTQDRTHPDTQFSFTILQGGGSLKVTRSSPLNKAPCTVALN